MLKLGDTVYMTKPMKTPDEIVRANLVNFREAAKLSQSDAAAISGVGIDNLRRYETGKTETVPGTALAALAKVYGHAIEDFHEADPPPAKLEEVPVFFLSTFPNATYDQILFKKLQAEVDKANREMRAAKRPKKVSDGVAKKD